MKFSFLSLSIFFFLSCTAQTSPADHVNTFIGTGGHGHTFPGAVSPFGMVQLSPDTRIDGSWDGCGGYYYSDSIIYGFSHTHLSGTGVSDYGDILLMPVAGKPVFDRNMYASKFRHNTEKSSPGYYSVQLEDDDIQAEMTASTRVGMHRYTFSKPGQVSFILDLEHRDALTEFQINVVSKTRIEGFRRSSGWAKDQVVYFAMDFSQPFFNTKYDTKKSKLGITFLLKNKNPVLVKVALSFTGLEGARANMQLENPDWNFDETSTKTRDKWNEELSKIEAKSKDKNELIKFYSALYHCMIHPGIASDVNGDYRGMDGKIHRAIGYNYYSVFSLWDTYRALHPLLTIIDKKRTLDFIQTFLAMYRDGGRLPMWELASNETDCMIGYHCASVITDAWSKGIRGFDSSLALEAMIKIAEENKYGKRDYIQHGFISSEWESESVSKTLEYAYDDWCIYQFALMTGNNSIAEKFKFRSNNWFNLYDPKNGFIHARYNGNWLLPFDPKEVNNHFTEANCWQYNFYVPQDVRRMMKVLGGPDAFGSKLDQLFAEKSKPSGRDQADITGLIGQYAHGNEPSHHMAYLYNYIYRPERTQHLVSSICRNFYGVGPDGLIGNEDCGQMSAWYVLSALGMYQVTPGFPGFTLSIPSLDTAIIHLENNNNFRIFSVQRNENTFFAIPNFEKETVMFLNYDQIQNGGDLRFHFVDIPDERLQDYFLPALPGNDVANPAPPLITVPRSFREPVKVKIEPVGKADRIYYYLDADSINPIFYTTPFVLDRSAVIHAFSVKEVGVEALRSPLCIAYANRNDKNWAIKLTNEPNKQYAAGGNEAVIDGIRGRANWRAGDWHGYQNNDFEAVIDLGSMKMVNQVSCGFLQDCGAWILMPKKLEVYLSTDGVNFTSGGVINNTISDKDMKVQIQNLVCKIKNPRKCRFVKIKAYNYGKLPEWHAGYPFAGDAFIFVDEVEIN